MDTTPRVFISYSHDSKEHCDRVLGLSQRLRQDGIETQLDAYENGTPQEGWPRWMLNRIDWANRILLICTPTYYRRFRGHEESGIGMGVNWEGAVITQEIYDTTSLAKRFVPVAFVNTDEPHIPEPVRGQTRYYLTSERAYRDLLDALLGQAGVKPAAVGERRHRSRQRAEPLTFGDSDDVSTDRMEPMSLYAKVDLATPSSPRTSRLSPEPTIPHDPTGRFGAIQSDQRERLAPQIEQKHMRRLVCQRISSTQLLDLDGLECPYGALNDPTEFDNTAENGINCILWIPQMQYIKTSPIQAYTPSVAICLESGPVDRTEMANFSANEISLLQMRPSKLRDQEKEKILAGIGCALNKAFIAAITLPATILQAGRRNPAVVYSAFFDILLLPLVQMHRNHKIEKFHLALTNSGEQSNNTIGLAKKILKAVYARSGSYDVTVIQEGTYWSHIDNMANFIAWTIGAAHNHGNLKWLGVLQQNLGDTAYSPMEQTVSEATSHD